MEETKKKTCFCVLAGAIVTLLLIATVSLLVALALPRMLNDGEHGDIPDYQTDEVYALLHVPHLIFNAARMKDVVASTPENDSDKVPTLATDTSMTVKPKLTNSAIKPSDVTDLIPRLNEFYLTLPDVGDTFDTSIINLPEKSDEVTEHPLAPTTENEDKEIISDQTVSPPPVVTISVSTVPLVTLPDFVFPESQKRPNRPAIVAEKVSSQHSYDFFMENVNFATSVEICRQINRGSRLISIESSYEKRIVDSYVRSHQLDMFGYKEDYLRYVWTGGYFDLDSSQPHALRWVDHPTPMEAFEYQPFCPESKDIHPIIDQALSQLKTQTFGLTNLSPCNRRWAHVIIDFTGRRIAGSCWQVYVRDVLSPDGLRLPFICKR